MEYKHSGMISEAESEELMSISLEQLTHTVQMVDDVVNWGESQLKYYASSKETISLREIIDNIFGHEALKARIKNNRLLNEVNGLRLFTDKYALTFIVRNLVSNANKFTENGCISVSARKTNDHFHISIKDTGMGMETSVADKLFGNQTVSTTGTRDEKGNGLGLLLIKEYIHKLHGTISVESAPGRGSCFTIQLSDH
jgi:signal transduction histidine kinase